MRRVVFTACSSSSLLPPHHYHYHHFLSLHRPFLSNDHLSLSKNRTTTTTTTTNLRDTASNLVEAGRLEELKLLVGNVVGSDNTEEVLSSEVLACAIVKEIGEGRVKGVAALFEWFSRLGFDVFRVFDDNLVLLSSECSCLVENGDLEEAVELLEVLADMTSYNILLKACCLSERVDLAHNIYAELRLLESTRALKLDVFTYSTIIKVFADAKLWQMAIKVKEDTLSAGVTPNTLTWSLLISACKNACLLDQATQLFEEMFMAGCEPNYLCFNSLLHAYVEGCQYDRAFHLFSAWKSTSSSDKSADNSSVDKNTSRIQPIDKDCLVIQQHYGSDTRHLSLAKSTPFEPTTATYNILLKACGTNIHRAKGLIDEMKASNLSPNQISWSIMIDIYGASGNVQGALEILKTMCESGMKLDVIAYTTAMKVTYNTLLRARSKFGSLQEIQQCLAIYQVMQKAGYKSNDDYLKLLIGEWCEGVLQNNNQEREYKLRDRADIGGLRSLLLDRVATQLQKNTGESLAVDIQGITKVEA